MSTKRLARMTGDIEDISLSSGTTQSFNEITGSTNLSIDNYTIENGLPRSRDYVSISRNSPTTLSPGNFLAITFDTVDTDIGGMADIANNRITIQKTGTYYLDFGSGMRITQVSGVSYFVVISILDSGTLALQGNTWHGGTENIYRCPGVHLIRRFTAGDNVGVFIFQDSGTINASIGSSFVDSERVRLKCVYLGE